MKIFCVGRNYKDHAKELNNPIPASPLIFMKPSTALLTDGKPFYIPYFSNDIHYELELVLKITKPGKAIEQQFAASYYSEIGLGIDFTARDLQDQLKAKGQPWELAKSFDNSACVGGFLPKSELNMEDIRFSLIRGEETLQQGSSADMLFSFDYLISYISKFFTLQTGDLIFTGTPSGVGRVEEGEHFVGLLEDRPLLHCTIK
ncbi:MAG: fumarylacetoacetate hydrolase family protein [Chitinophagales bacterium]|nr:fumarylacetoacetate hydrolase family protein [Chitinophagales bacterium]